MNIAESVLTSLLANATKDTIVHLKYTAGRPSTDQAINEYEMALDWKKPSDEYVGHFEGLKRNKRGELVLTLFVHNRGGIGAFRAFNPSLGHLKDIRVEG